jgi:hypothetical protein
MAQPQEETQSVYTRRKQFIHIFRSACDERLPFAGHRVTSVSILNSNDAILHFQLAVTRRPYYQVCMFVPKEEPRGVSRERAQGLLFFLRLIREIYFTTRVTTPELVTCVVVIVDADRLPPPQPTASIDPASRITPRQAVNHAPRPARFLLISSKGNRRIGSRMPAVVVVVSASVKTTVIE